MPRAMIGKGAKNMPARPKRMRQDQLVAHHVSEKTERQGQDAGHMADDLDGQNDGDHPPHRPEKMFDVLGAVILDPDNVGENHHHQGAGQAWC